jgi:hypothetical protein
MKIFVPFIIYLVVFAKFGSEYAGPFLDLLADLEGNAEQINTC